MYSVVKSDDKNDDVDTDTLVLSFGVNITNNAFITYHPE